MGRQHQGMDRPGVRQVPEGSEEQGKIEKAGCKIICGAQTTIAIKGWMMMMMMCMLFCSRWSIVELMMMCSSTLHDMQVKLKVCVCVCVCMCVCVCVCVQTHINTSTAYMYVPTHQYAKYACACVRARARTHTHTHTHTQKKTPTNDRQKLAFTKFHFVEELTEQNTYFILSDVDTPQLSRQERNEWWDLIMTE